MKRLLFKDFYTWLTELLVSFVGMFLFYFLKIVLKYPQACLEDAPCRINNAYIFAEDENELLGLIVKYY